MTRFITFILLAISSISWAQVSNVSDQEELQRLFQQFKQKELQDQTQAQQIANTGNVRVMEITERGEKIQLVGFDPNGFPIFFENDNANAAATVGTNLVVAGAANGYGLTGNGMIIGEWDGGKVESLHQELTGRVSQTDGATSLSDHATHVAGTMIASGVVTNAKGMATAATISAHDFYGDDAEMTTFAASGLLSNHSYGRITGWREMTNGDWRWYGNTAISGVEDYMFGFYSSDARNWDLIANAAPNYLIVKSAGNDRNDNPPSSVTSHFIYSSGSWVASTVSRPADGGTDGYDCISSSGNSKNILTVGAVSDIAAGWSQASNVVMSSFSGWGPTDDGRIKPDIVANGVSLYSTGSSSITDYYSSSGTSMSAPNATGSMALLQEMYNDSNSSYMNASSLKALVIHTANEAGLTGPDYKYGWGLLNIKGAADLIADTTTNRIIEATLSNSSTDSYTFYSDGTGQIEATIVWNDPAHTVPTASLDPSTSMLVNDLDLRITNATGTIKTPWVLNNATPSVAATNGDNVKDNVENVIFASPGIGAYTFTIGHKGTLAASQNYSLIISGIQLTPAAPAPTPSFTSTATSICEGDSVYFTDTSTGSPTALEWTFTGGSPTTSASATPQVGYALAGNYTVKLKATNANGSDSIIQTNFITVTAQAVISISPLADVCVSSGSVTLSGATPTGGTWSGTGVTAGSFDPMAAGIGSHLLTYTYIGGACTTSATATINVVAPPSVTLPNFAASICDNSVAFMLSGGTPIGGIYSGTGVSNNMFDPSVSGTGSHNITYTFTNSGGCAGSDTKTLFVMPGTATSLANLSDVCDSSGIVTLSGGTPSGGYYTGIGVDTTAGTFDPSVAGVGTHTITYFGSGGLCVSASTNTISVNPLPTVSLNSFADECLATTSVTLAGGTPSGGIYSGTAVNAGVFDPSAAGLGTHWIYYSYADPVTLCSGIDSATITVVNSIQFALSDTSVCETQTAFTLAGGTPTGGNYSGNGVLNGVFDPALAGVGIHAITYTNTVNTCASAGTADFTVTASPTVVLTPFNPVCLMGGMVSLSGGLPTGGTYSGVGVTNNMLDPTINGIGIVSITYTYTTTGCSNSAIQDIVIGMGTPEIVNIKTSYCVNDPSGILIGNPSGGVYSGSGITDSIFDPNAAGVGFHTISYTTTGGCAGSVSNTVQVHPKPVIGNIDGPLISSQNTVAGYDVLGQNGSFYSWSVTGGSIVNNSNNQITVEWDTSSSGFLEVIIYDPNGCKDTTNVTVNLWPVSVEDLGLNNSIGFYPNPVKETITFTGDFSTQENVELVIVNLVGKVIHTESKYQNKGSMNWSIDVSSWVNGSYLFVLQTTDGILSKGQFLKQ